LSQASAMRSNPFLVPAENRNPAVIAMSYLCREQRVKSVFSLIICKSLCPHVDAPIALLTRSSCYRCRCFHVFGLLGDIYGCSITPCLSGRYPTPTCTPSICGHTGR
jgi:hypothetical protein